MPPKLCFILLSIFIIVKKCSSFDCTDGDVTFICAAFLSFVTSQTCEKSHYERCLKQLLYFTEKRDLLFASSAEELTHECAQAQSSLGCLTRYSKKCLSPEERPQFNEGISGPQKLTLGLCIEDSDLRSKYILSLSCLRNISDGLQYCKEKYDRNQRDILLVEYEDKTHLQCCSFDGYRRCLKMLMETQDGCREGTSEVIQEIASRLGGSLSENTCTQYFERCTGGGAAGIQTILSIYLLILASFMSALLTKIL